LHRAQRAFGRGTRPAGSNSRPVHPHSGQIT
jgi:hypothetical protein